MWTRLSLTRLLWKRLDISNDDFLRTGPRNVTSQQAVMQKIFDQGDIYKKTMKVG